MKTSTLCVLAVLSLLCTIPGSAQQTDVPHSFQAGTPARASEVNENFSALATAITANSAALQPLFSVIPIEQSIHHLGDGMNFGTYVVPDAEGPNWAGIFSLSPQQFNPARTAHLQMLLFDNGVGSISINGNRFQLPHNEQRGEHFLQGVADGKVMLSIPIGFLLVGENAIAFQAGGIPNAFPPNLYDDFEFGQVSLILN